MKESTVPQEAPELIIVDLVTPQLKNIIRLVDVENNSRGLSQSNLIKLTEKLSEAAKSGKLKGLIGCAEYDDGYTFGAEGTYLIHPETAILPLTLLHQRTLRQIEKED